MLKTILLSLALFALTMFMLGGGLGLWVNFSDKRQVDGFNWQIWSAQSSNLGTYTPEMVANLPINVQRYFNFMIAPGAELKIVNRFEMEGEFGLGDVESHAYHPFTASQYNAAPKGFTWSLQTHDTAMFMNGSDILFAGQSHTKFWLFGVLPVARLGNNDDHLRSAFGRMAIEMAAWSPAALLPQFGTQWESVAPNVIRAKIQHNSLSQNVDITLDEDGAPLTFSIERWSDANKDKIFRLQPFGGKALAYQTFEGITVVSEVEVGNHFGTPAYFPFFKARVTRFEHQPNN